MPPRVAPVASCFVLVRMLRSLRSRTSSLTLPSSRYRRKIDLTSSASSSTMAILPSFISFPRGRLPPTQIPFRFDAAILSRMRSEVTSRSNWAKDKSTLRVSRPIEVVVLNCWVTETNETPWASKSSTSLAKSAILAKQRRQRLGEVAGRDPLQVKDRQQRLDRFRAAHVRRQDRRREPDAVGVGSVCLAIAYTRLADGDRTDTGHHLAFPAGDRGARRAGGRPQSSNRHACRESPRPRPRPPGPTEHAPIAQDFGELIVDVSWLNQLDDVIFGHGISLLRWRSGGLNHPHDMPPSRFPPSPTFSDSSSPHAGRV